MNLELGEKLISMSEAESKARLTLTQNGNRFEGVPRAFEDLRIVNAEELDKIIKEHGWP